MTQYTCDGFRSVQADDARSAANTFANRLARRTTQTVKGFPMPSFSVSLTMPFIQAETPEEAVWLYRAAMPHYATIAATYDVQSEEDGTKAQVEAKTAPCDLLDVARMLVAWQDRTHDFTVGDCVMRARAALAAIAKAGG